MSAGTIFTEDQDQHKVVLLASERMDAFPDTHDQDAWYWSPVESGVAGGWDEFGIASDLGKSTDLPLSPLAMRECGSTACCAGHIVLAAIDLGMELRRGEHIADEAQRLIGISCDTAEDLFDAHGHEETVREWMREAAAMGRAPDWVPKADP